MITNCGPLVLRHDAKGPQVVITTGGPSQVLVSILDSGLGFGGCAGAHITIRLESVPETLAPASPPGLPAQLPFRRVVGRASDLVIIDTATSPTASLASQTGRCRGSGASRTRARYGSHTPTSAGSSSTTS